MSKVAISGNASGTGTLTIAAPNTNSNYQLDLPTASGTVQVSGNPISGTTGTFSSTISGASTIGVGGATPSASGAGITFPATQSASTDANTLDDYEEGTWTPSLNFAGASVGITYQQRNGYYTKVGSLVNAYCYIYLSNKGSSTGTAFIAGLPFANGGNSNQYAASAMWAANLTSTGQVFAYADPNATQVILASLASGTGNQNLVANTNFSNNTEVMINITYRTV